MRVFKATCDILQSLILTSYQMPGPNVRNIYPHKDDLARVDVLDCQIVGIQRSFARTAPWKDFDSHWIAQVQLVNQPLSIGLVHSCKQLLPENLRLLRTSY